MGYYNPTIERIKMMRRLLTTILLFALSFSSIAGSQADRRIFGYTYPYMTLPKGTLELEHYLDIGLNKWDNSATPDLEESWTQVDWKHQIEFEYGITDRLDFGFYNVFSQKPYGTFSYDGLKLRSRYRFLDPGALFIDPAIYLEVGYFGEEIKFEEMIILAKHLGNFELAFNAKAEQEIILEDKSWEYELLPLVGVGYHFNHNFALSLEYYGKLKIEQGEVEYFVSYLGPALSVAGGNFYWTVAIQPQLGTRDSLAAVQIRSLFGAIL